MLFKHIFFMRVLFCKIHCPSFICFCKPSSHLYTPGPLKLENTPHVPVSSTCVSLPSTSHEFSGEIEVRKEQQILKSSLKKAPPPSETISRKVVERKRVQWMDNLGKQLVEIKEFEASEVEDSDNEGENNRGCLCIIL